MAKKYREITLRIPEAQYKKHYVEFILDTLNEGPSHLWRSSQRSKKDLIAMLMLDDRCQKALEDAINKRIEYAFHSDVYGWANNSSIWKDIPYVVLAQTELKEAYEVHTDIKKQAEARQFLLSRGYVVEPSFKSYTNLLPLPEPEKRA